MFTRWRTDYPRRMIAGTTSDVHSSSWFPLCVFFCLLWKIGFLLLSLLFFSSVPCEILGGLFTWFISTKSRKGDRSKNKKKGKGFEFQQKKKMALEAQVLSDLQSLIGEVKKKNPQAKEVCPLPLLSLPFTSW